jgi:hypothetical protein
MRIGARVTVRRATRRVEHGRGICVLENRGKHTALATRIVGRASQRISNRQLARLENISNSLKTKGRLDF